MLNLFNNKYPYTDFHELNLDWLLETYQQIVDHVNELLTWMATHKVEYAEAMARLTAVENEIQTFEARIEREFNALETSLQSEFAQLQTDIEKELKDTQKEIEDDFNNAIRDFTNDFEALKRSIQSDITNMEIEIRHLITYLNNSMAVINENVMDYVEARLDRFIRELPDYEDLIIYNPVRGIQTNVQTAINDLYSAFAVFGLTASQYDSLQLTAAEYDAYGLEARQYDLYGYKL